MPFTTRRNLQEIIRLMEEGRLAIDPMTTHHVPLREVAQAVDLLIDHPDQALGVILSME